MRVRGCRELEACDGVDVLPSDALDGWLHYLDVEQILKVTHQSRA